jgi:hypothetical protein
LNDITKRNNNNVKRSRRGNTNQRQDRGPSQREPLTIRGKFRPTRDVVHRYERTSVAQFALSPTLGWGLGGAFDLEIDFSLNTTQYYVGGSSAGNIANPGASELVALYDQYRIDMVEVSFMYGANAVAPGPASTPNLPILNIVFDPSDNSVITLTSILQYQNLQTVMLGNSRTQDGYVLSCRPVPDLYAGASAGALVPTSAQWIAVDLPIVPHHGLKIVYDPAAVTSSASIGNVSIYVKYHYSMKSSH